MEWTPINSYVVQRNKINDYIKVSLEVIMESTSPIGSCLSIHCFTDTTKTTVQYHKLNNKTIRVDLITYGKTREDSKVKTLTDLSFTDCAKLTKFHFNPEQAKILSVVIGDNVKGVLNVIN